MDELVQPGVYPAAAGGRLAGAIRPVSPAALPTPHPDDVGTTGRRVALLGLADDTGVGLNGGRLGARDGPRAFRAALARYGVAQPMDFPDRGLAYPEVYDVGDIVPGATLSETHERVTTVTLALLRAGMLPVGVGGGHDLTFPLVRALLRFRAEHDQRNWPAANGVYVDPHLDVRPEPGSGMAFRALLDQTGLKSLVNVGANPLVNSAEHWSYFLGRGGRALAAPAWAADEDRFAEIERAIEEAWFVSLDLDALDASVAPGVSALNPEGLPTAVLSRMARSAGASLWVGCFDVMELNPAHDEQGRTARVAAHLFQSFLCGVAERLTGPGIDWG